MKKMFVTMGILFILFSFFYIDSQNIQIRIIVYNPNVADYTGLGYADYPPPAIYVPPLDPAPGLVQIGPDLIPNFQVSDESFSGTCTPGDTITFLTEVYNGSGAPMSVLVVDDIPTGMINPANVGGFPAGVIDPIANTITWNLPALAPGYTLLAYQADVLADGSVNFGNSIVNSGATIYYTDAGIPRIQIASPVTINVQAAQIVKEVFQDVACTIPAPNIVPGSRLYYRLTVYNSIDPLSPNLYTAFVTEASDAIPPFVTDLQPIAAAAPYAPPIPGAAFANTGTTVTWTHAGFNLPPGVFINAANRNATHSVFIPLGSAGRVVNNAQLTYNVNWPPLTITTLNINSNEVSTWIGSATFGQINSLFALNTFFVAGDQAYCTDVLGAAKIAYGLADSGVTNNPEGRTDLNLTSAEHDNGNLIPVGGPAINPLAVEFGGYFNITYNYIENVSFEIFADGYSIFLDIGNYPQEDICIVYVSEHNERNVLLVWGYGWQGTYAGSVLMGDPLIWQAYSGYHMFLLRWRDTNSDGLIQSNEITIEEYN